MATQKEHGITWTEETWNPIRGCSRVSEGCRNCYAERTAAFRHSGGGRPYEGLAMVKNGQPRWTGEVRVVEERMLDPLRWRRPRRIFVNSMSDLFHEKVPDATIDRIFAVMALCPQHTFQVLTKRAARMLQWSRDAFTEAGGLRIAETASSLFHGMSIKDRHLSLAEQAAVSNKFEWRELKNVWLGVSVEDQAAADERIPLLLQTPAAVRWISAEPLLGPIDLTVLKREPSDFDRSLAGFDRCAGFFTDSLAGSNGVLMKDGVCHEEPVGAQPRLDWVVVGGESGPGARPMHPDWARSLRDQCAAAGVAFHFKQWGGWGPIAGREDLPGKPVMVGPGDVLMLRDGAVQSYDECGGVGDHACLRHVGKRAAGRVLDGETWDQYPEVRA